MPIFILLSTLTQQGVQTLKSNPERLRQVNQDIEELGARVLHQWATLGEFDFVNIVDAPDIATVAKVSVTLGARVDADRDASGTRDRGVPADSRVVPPGPVPNRRLPVQETHVTTDGGFEEGGGLTRTTLARLA